MKLSNVLSREYIHIVAREFFQISLVTYLILTVAETLKGGFVTNFFNMNYLLAIVMTSGTAMILTEPSESIVGQVVDRAKEASKAATTATRQVARTAHRRVVRPAINAIRPTRGPHVLDLRNLPTSPAQPAKKSQKSPSHTRQLG